MKMEKKPRGVLMNDSYANGERDRRGEFTLTFLKVVRRIQLKYHLKELVPLYEDGDAPMLVSRSPDGGFYVRRLWPEMVQDPNQDVIIGLIQDDLGLVG